MSNIQINYFHRLPIGQKFQTHLGGEVFTKTRKGGTEFDNGNPYNINSQKLVILVEDQQTEKSWQELEFHTFEFTERQLADVIEKIIERAQETYGDNRINADRLRAGLYAAHRAKPIRLIALLNACAIDFPADVLYGVYRHYDPATDSIKGGWTAQHSEPHEPGWLDFLFGRL